MAIKVIMVFNGTTTRQTINPSIGYTGRSHAFGFTEGYWLPQSDLTSGVRQLIDSISRRRAALLPVGVNLDGIRIYAGGTGAATIIPTLYPGSALSTDVANVGLLCSTQVQGYQRQRKWWVHCIPDSMVVEGEFSPNPAYAALVQAYFGNSGIGAASFLRQNYLNIIRIVSVAANGQVTFVGNHSFAVGQLIRIVRSSSDGRRHGGNFTVGTVGPLGSQLTVLRWPYGDTEGGQAYQSQFLLAGIALNGQFPYAERIGTKRVGRPTELYRGRKSARR